MDIFERYQHKEKYGAALHIFRTEARIQKLLKKIHSAPKKIYFISEEKLFSEKEKAVFESFFGSLPLKHLLYYSFTEGSMENLDRNDLKELVQSGYPRPGSSVSLLLLLEVAADSERKMRTVGMKRRI